MSHAKTANHKKLASMFNTLSNPKPGSGLLFCDFRSLKSRSPPHDV